MNLARRIYDISPVTYCHQPNYNPSDGKILPWNENPAKILLIQGLIRSIYDKTFEELSANNRRFDIVKIRHITMYMLRWHGGMKLIKIGKMFGNRDHTTVIHACKSVADLMFSDPEYRKEVQNFEFLINGGKVFDLPFADELI